MWPRPWIPSDWEFGRFSSICTDGCVFDYHDVIYGENPPVFGVPIRAATELVLPHRPHVVRGRQGSGEYRCIMDTVIGEVGKDGVDVMGVNRLSKLAANGDEFLRGLGQPGRTAD